MAGASAALHCAGGSLTLVFFWCTALPNFQWCTSSVFLYCVHISAQALVALALAAPLDTMIGLPLYKADFQNVKAKSLTLDGE